MRRPRTSAGPGGSPLFPFLAVLLCTMGALIVMLVVIASQARAQAALSAQNIDGAAARAAEALQAERDDLKLQIAQWEQVRDATAADLDNDRRELSHLEEFVRRLRDRLAALQEAARALETARAGSGAAADDAQLGELQRQVAVAEQALDEARAEAEGRPRSYSIVPYEGAHGTRRRPIYIECRDDRVILQPEGVTLTARDFASPLGPGNPLASALRAAQDRLRTTDPDLDPYPLILVRPAGIAAYYKVRGAIESWGDDFGYELIDEEWPLAFPPADVALAEVERRAVAEARRRRERLAVAAPSRYGGGRGGYRATPHRGGFYREGSGGKRPGGFGGGDGRGFGEAGRGGAGAGDGGTARLGAAGGIDGRAGVNGFGGDGATRGDGGLTGDRGGLTEGSYRGATGEAGRSTAGGGQYGAGQGGAGQEGPALTRGGDRPGGGSGGGYARGSEAVGGNRPGGGTQQSAATGGGSAGGVAGGSAADGSVADGSAASGGGSGGVSGPASGGASGGQGAPRDAAGQPATPTFRLTPPPAARRGRNWALQSGGRGVPLSRPVQVACYADRLEILPERGGGGGARVPLEGGLPAALDEFVSALWEHTASWGIAGKGLYWRPVLTLRTAPGAARQASELRRLLEGSGLQVQEGELR